MFGIRRSMRLKPGYGLTQPSVTKKQRRVAKQQLFVSTFCVCSNRNTYTFALSKTRKLTLMETKIIGGKIAEARKKTNLSQAQLAQQLFISPQAVGKWQRGESMPDIVTLNRLAEILGVDLNYFSQAFPSAVTETTASAYQTTKAHTWDMSLGNWIDADFSGLKN